ncbi:MAG: molecular chaperone HtpG [Desulfovibrionaceae bacterium]|nr:molecular chaperone HtpG [Desulfovibrionaceae bacterium]
MPEAESKQYAFRAETAKVLAILTHSLYTNREIFLRELISNASDAEEKLRFLQGRGDAVRDADLPLEISIAVDKVQKTVSITDAGIGMTAQDMQDNLGVIAHSGTEQFLKEMEENKGDASSLIGRFGIGFYSVFMVADKVEVVSRAAEGDEPPHKWTSDGVGEFTIETLDAADESIRRGTTVRLFLKEDAEEFLESWRLENIIRKHSSFVPFPVMLDGKRVNTTPALWREPKFSITKEQYADFYKFLTYDNEAPLSTLHLSVDAPVQFSGLMFIPDHDSDPMNLQREHWGLDLYVRRVLIQRENKTLLPEYLSFFKGVVDTEDLPLNISRETLQENVVLRKIAQTLAKQALSELERIAANDKPLYESFWKHHGNVFKLGYNDYPNRERITGLLRFNSSALEAEGLTSLEEYVSRMKEGQKEIWFASAPNREAAQVNPHLEMFRRKGIEVLYLYAPVDEFCLETLGKFKDFSFKAVEHADNATLDSFADAETDKPKVQPLSDTEKTAFDGLLARIRTVLGDRVTEVRESHRLTDSAACLVSPDANVTSSMEKIMHLIQKDDSIPKKIFEINKDHPLLRSLLRVYESGSDDALLDGMIENLFDTTLMLDGYLADPHALAARINGLLEKAGGWYADLRGMKK